MPDSVCHRKQSLYCLAAALCMPAGIRRRVATATRIGMPFGAELEAVHVVQSKTPEASMARFKFSVVVASLLVFNAAGAFARGGGGGPGGPGGGPGGGLGGPLAGAGLHGMPSQPSPPSLPSHGGFTHVPGAPPHGLMPHAPTPIAPHGNVHAPKNKARGLDRAMSRMSPHGAKNTNNPRSPNRAHGRARAAERHAVHALLDRPGRR
jgi:hypothetical protein